MTPDTNNLELHGKNIVIIEDDLSLSVYYKAILTNTGAEVKIFHTGKDFTDYLGQKNIKIDLVFMDFLVPLINGIDCIRIFRKQKKSTPVIMITAYTSDEAKTEAFLAGANEYLVKPVFPEKIVSMVEKYLKPNITVHSPE